ncbi:AraC family transcriptional regulator [Saccharothrix sp. NRRL B-16348]|uniref:GlxA family transcriptional regulator n=1 Tax=Saccharothrix sp. NRRL B-16348 TaxID=1415542 RepID=UPI0006C30348|nr:helix-turn-helix domain-containing protein [Saccharothrix sp. NRRL B-16348]KOX13042.1 AraC family transcriptional regulator [Saccharothrix sp. NRRL B-16348]
MDSRHLVAVLALDEVVTFDLGTPTQVFNAARDEHDRRYYRVRICTPGGRPVRSAAGFTITPDHGLELLAEADTVIVAGVSYGARVLADGTLDEPVRDALLAAAERGARVMSICTGAFVLAAAGLLDGRKATTHWAHADNFRRLFPDVDLDPDVLFVDEGDVLTSAGVAAGVDLCLHLVRHDHGSGVANMAARRCVVPPWRPGGQSQFIVRPIPDRTDTSTAPARAWAAEHLHEPLDLRALAAHVRMSVRTFTRRFREETGVSPGKWITQQRVERARHLLETTDLAIDQVARHAGFGTGAALRQQMSATLGVAPSVYRTTFRSVG